MLAAASPFSDRGLEAIKLALLLEAARKDYPATLKKHLFDVIAETLRLMQKPDENAAKATSEAVTLAVRISSNAALRDVIQSIAKNRAVSVDQARDALKNLEADTDTSSQSAHFSEAIYAAI